MHFVDTDDKSKAGSLEQEITEEKFFEQFAALEENLALLQIHMRDMSDNAKLFSSLAMRLRRSVRPAATARGPTRPVAACPSACGLVQELRGRIGGAESATRETAAASPEGRLASPGSALRAVRAQAPARNPPGDRRLRVAVVGHGASAFALRASALRLTHLMAPPPPPLGRNADDPPPAHSPRSPAPRPPSERGRCRRRRGASPSARCGSPGRATTPMRRCAGSL